MEISKTPEKAGTLLPDKGVLKLKSIEVYFAVGVVGEGVTIEQVQEHIEEAEQFPIYDSTFIKQQQLADAVKESIENPHPEDAEWREGDYVYPDWRRTRLGKHYAANVGHYCSADRAPENAATNLWREVAPPSEYEVWKQPTGAHDAYGLGQIVWYPEKDTQLYISKMEGNTAEPTKDEPFNRYWEEYTEE